MVESGGNIFSVHLGVCITCLILLVILYLKNRTIGSQKKKSSISCMYFISGAIILLEMISAVIFQFSNRATVFTFVLKSVCFLLLICTSICWFCICNNQMTLVKVKDTVFWSVGLLPVYFISILIITSWWSGYIFSIDESGMYKTGSYFNGIYYVTFLYNLFAIVLTLINCKKSKEKDEKRFMFSLVYIPIPFMCTFLLQLLTKSDYGFLGFIASLAMYDIEYLRQQCIDKAKIENKAKELELQQLQAKNDIESAKAASKSKSTFLFNMSHDIRTPMNAIIGFSAMAKKYINNKEKVLDCLEKIDVSGNHLLKLINDVLDMARIESGKIIIEETEVNVIKAANDLISIVKEGADANNLKLSLQLSKIRTPDVYADVLHVNQIFLNIISNSIKYTKPGGKIIYTIVQTESSKKGYAAFNFVFEDTGIGMSKEFLDRVFESFSRAESSTVSGIPGTGLGMPIAKQLVEKMGGEINIASELGVGTTVNVHMEFQLQQIKVEPKVPPKIVTNFPILQGKRVLLVEDNELNREIAVDILEGEGLIIEDAEDGSVAVEKIKNKEPSYYDYVLMDIQMPYMDGYTATRVIRSLDNADYSKLPIIAMTANAFDEDRENAFKAGMNAHVPKPIKVEDLFRIMTEFSN